MMGQFHENVNHNFKISNWCKSAKEDIREQREIMACSTEEKSIYNDIKVKVLATKVICFGAWL
jgi:hypothetical protein